MYKDKKGTIKKFGISASDMESFCNTFFYQNYPTRASDSHEWHPLTDIVETDRQYVIKMELAGVKSEDLSVDLHDNYLIIKGVRHDTGTKYVKGFHRMEIHYGKFQRVLLLHSGVEKDSVDAELKDGFLYITVDKSEPVPNKKRIKIKKHGTDSKL